MGGGFPVAIEQSLSFLGPPGLSVLQVGWRHLADARPPSKRTEPTFEPHWAVKQADAPDGTAAKDD